MFFKELAGSPPAFANVFPRACGPPADKAYFPRRVATRRARARNLRAPIGFLAFDRNALAEEIVLHIVAGCAIPVATTHADLARGGSAASSPRGQRRSGRGRRGGH